MTEAIEGTATTYPVAVIMQRTAIVNRWIDAQWEVQGVVRDTSPAGTPEREIVRSEGVMQVLFPGHLLRLMRDEAEGYYMNITSPQPKVFVLWRMRDDVACPHMLSVSYNEGTRWADSGEQVDGVALPPELAQWMADFVLEHYRPEPQKKKRYASTRDKGRMGRIGQ